MGPFPSTSQPAEPYVRQSRDGTGSSHSISAPGLVAQPRRRIPHQIRGKYKEKDPADLEKIVKELYHEPQVRPAEWGRRWADGRHRAFAYTCHGELLNGRFFASEVMQEYLTECSLENDFVRRNGVQQVESYSLPMNQSSAEQSHQRLSLWIGWTPSQVRHRYPSDFGSRCRFDNCSISTKTISTGEPRVILDERNNLTGRHNPYHNAGYVHLYCLEKRFDLMELFDRGLAKFDNRYFIHEEINAGHLNKRGQSARGSMHVAVQWRRAETRRYREYRQSLGEDPSQPTTGPLKHSRRPRHFYESLTYALTVDVVQHTHDSLKRTRNKRAMENGKGFLPCDMSRHLGNLDYLQECKDRSSNKGSERRLAERAKWKRQRLSWWLGEIPLLDTAPWNQGLFAVGFRPAMLREQLRPDRHTRSALARSWIAGGSSYGSYDEGEHRPRKRLRPEHWQTTRDFSNIDLMDQVVTNYGHGYDSRLYSSQQQMAGPMYEGLAATEWPFPEGESDRYDLNHDSMHRSGFEQDPPWDQIFATSLEYVPPEVSWQAPALGQQGPNIYMQDPCVDQRRRSANHDLSPDSDVQIQQTRQIGGTHMYDQSASSHSFNISGTLLLDNSFQPQMGAALPADEQGESDLALSLFLDGYLADAEVDMAVPSGVTLDVPLATDNHTSSEEGQGASVEYPSLSSLLGTCTTLLPGQVGLPDAQELLPLDLLFQSVDQSYSIDDLFGLPPTLSPPGQENEFANTEFQILTDYVLPLSPPNEKHVEVAAQELQMFIQSSAPIELDSFAISPDLPAQEQKCQHSDNDPRAAPESAVENNDEQLVTSPRTPPPKKRRIVDRNETQQPAGGEVMAVNVLPSLLRTPKLPRELTMPIGGNAQTPPEMISEYGDDDLFGSSPPTIPREMEDEMDIDP